MPTANPSTFASAFAIEVCPRDSLFSPTVTISGAHGVISFTGPGKNIDHVQSHSPATLLRAKDDRPRRRHRITGEVAGRKLEWF